MAARAGVVSEPGPSAEVSAGAGAFTSFPPPIPNHFVTPTTSRADEGDEEDVDESDSETEIEAAEYERRRDAILRRLILCEVQIARIKATAKASKLRALERQRADVIEGGDSEYVEKSAALDQEYDAKVEVNEKHSSLAVDALARKVAGQIDFSERSLLDHERTRQQQMLERLHERRDQIILRIRELRRRRRKLRWSALNEEEGEEEWLKDTDTIKELNRLRYAYGRVETAPEAEDLPPPLQALNGVGPSTLGPDEYPEWMYEDSAEVAGSPAMGSRGERADEDEEAEDSGPTRIIRVHLGATEEQIMEDLLCCQVNREDSTSSSDSRGSSSDWSASEDEYEEVEEKGENTREGAADIRVWNTHDQITEAVEDAVASVTLEDGEVELKVEEEENEEGKEKEKKGRDEEDVKKRGSPAAETATLNGKKRKAVGGGGTRKAKRREDDEKEKRVEAAVEDDQTPSTSRASMNSLLDTTSTTAIAGKGLAGESPPPKRVKGGGASGKRIPLVPLVGAMAKAAAAGAAPKRPPSRRKRNSTSTEAKTPPATTSEGIKLANGHGPTPPPSSATPAQSAVRRRSPRAAVSAQ